MIHATMATTPERVTYAAKAFRTLLHQTDRRSLYVNGTREDIGEDLAEVLQDGLGVQVFFTPDGDLADFGKFYPKVREEDVWLTVDDDLIYPADYVRRIVEGLERYPGAVVSFHGAKLQRPFVSYYRSRKSYPCLQTVEHDERVDVGGTGVMAFPPGMCPYLGEPWPYMADLVVARWAKRAGVSIVVLKHEHGWLKHQAIDHSQTIFSRFAKHDEFQTWYCRRYIL